LKHKKYKQRQKGLLKMKEAYETLKQKHDLPELNFMEEKFEISTLDESPFLLRDIRRRMNDRIEFMIKVLDGVVQPDTVFTDMHEFKSLNEEDKKTALQLYKRLMKMNRTAVVLAIKSTNEEEAAFIRTSSSSWDNVQDSLARIMAKIRDSWTRDFDVEEEVGYLG